MGRPDPAQNLARLFCEPQQFTGETLQLEAAQVHYLKRVLRLSVGNPFIALDGQGGCWKAVLEGTQARLVEKLDSSVEAPFPIALACGIPKGERMDWLVQKAVELGIHDLYPLVTARTVVSDPSPHKVQRWGVIAKEAAEQSERSLLPKVHPVQSWADFLSSVSTGIGQDRLKVICLARGAQSSLGSMLKAQGPKPILLLTGPEGGFATQEIEQAQQQGFIAAHLGPRILRAETAPLVALSLLLEAYETY
jgi:16S rRNA (uracil1498-N3)-methyltransferase